MKDLHDEEIDRVLQALGTAEPAGGMEARIFERLAVAPERQAVWPVRFGWCVGAALALGLLTLAIWPTRRPGLTVRTAVLPSVRAGAHAGFGVVLPAPAPVPPAAGLNKAAELREVAIKQGEASRGVAGVDTLRGSADLPSVLAPAPPVTTEERILLGAAQAPAKEELALLNPDTRERLAQQSAAEFKQFFPPPTPQEVYLATHTSD